MSNDWTHNENVRRLKFTPHELPPVQPEASVFSVSIGHLKHKSHAAA